MQADDRARLTINNAAKEHQVGSMVYVRNFRKAHKFSHRFTGPHEVLENKHPVYQVRISEHVVKKYHFNDLCSVEEIESVDNEVNEQVQTSTMPADQATAEHNSPIVRDSTRNQSSDSREFNGGITHAHTTVSDNASPQEDYSSNATGKPEDVLYEVEKIVRTKKIRGKQYYLIKGAGYPASQNTWEPAENIVFEEG